MSISHRSTNFRTVQSISSSSIDHLFEENDAKENVIGTGQHGDYLKEISSQKMIDV